LNAQIRDGGVDPSNLGKGDWIYILSNAINQLGGSAPSVTDLASLMAYEKNLGVQYLIIKAADGSSRFPSDANPQFTSDVVNAGHEAGLKVFAYNFSYGTDIPGEINMANYAYGQGADGLVLDAEGAWESLANNTTAATNLCGSIRANWPTKFLAHSPFAYISVHGSFPYREFGYYCDAAMPQDYFIEFGQTPTASASQMDGDWRNWQNSLSGIWTNSIKPIVPIGQGWTSSHGTITAALITEFVNALKSLPSPATKGGYKGVNFWRAELHPADVLAAIRTNTIGTVPTNAPVLGNISAGALTASSAVITWTTDQSSDSVVEYGLSTSYGNSITNGTSLYYHSVALSALSANTTYHFRVKSKNGFNNQGGSGDYVLTTASVTVSDVIVESRLADGSLNSNPPYSDTLFANSTLKSTASGLSGVGSRYAFNTGSTFAVNPALAVAGGSYDVYVTHGSASSISADLVVAISESGCTGLPGNTGLFRQSYANAWENIGRITLNSGNAVAALTFSYSSGTLNSTNGRFYSDAVKFVYVPPPPTAPSIAMQPANQAVNSGDSAGFTVAASGTGPLTYQWRFKGSDIPNATSSSYVRSNAQTNDVGNYSVFITKSFGSILSSNALLTVNVPASIIGQPQNVLTNAGSDVLFTVLATGTAPLSYQWRFNGTEIPQATGSSYATTNVQSADQGNYSVVVSNVAATVVSADATLTLSGSQPNPPHIDSIELLSDGSAQLDISGGPGTFAIEAAPGLNGWTQLSTVTATTGIFQYTDSETNQTSRFYRVRLVP